MKRILCFLLPGFLMLSLAACGYQDSSISDAIDPPAVGNNAPEVTDDTEVSESDAPAVNSSEPSSVEDSTNAEGASSNTDVDISMEDGSSNEEHEEEANMQQNIFYVTVGSETFSATFAESSGAQALKELLADGDITIQMSDYGGFEKVGPLGQSLPTENSQTTTQAGDIVLYQGNQIVIFYGSNSWSYTRLGKIDVLTDWQESVGSGDIEVTFSLQSQ